MLNAVINLLSADLFAPDGGITDPRSPIYALLWVLEVLA